MTVWIRYKVCVWVYISDCGWFLSENILLDWIVQRWLTTACAKEHRPSLLNSVTEERGGTLRTHYAFPTLFSCYAPSPVLIDEQWKEPSDLTSHFCGWEQDSWVNIGKWKVMKYNLLKEVKVRKQHSDLTQNNWNGQTLFVEENGRKPSCKAPQLLLLVKLGI